MRIVFLGTGTSTGIPTLGCTCAICTSQNPKNKRMRASICVEAPEGRILVDCGPDFRTQAIANGISDVHSLLLTHTHADHINGLDDLRAFNMVHRHRIPIYAAPESLDDLKSRFAYCFRPAPPGGGIPEFDLHPLVTHDMVAGIDVQVLPVFHGCMSIRGYRFGKFAYLTDVSKIPEETYQLLEGVEVLVTSALRRRPHPTHMSVDEAVAAARRVGARQTWFTHMCHDLEHEATNAILPDNVRLAYDGLVIEL